MAQRHDHDTIERLWPGAADPTDPRFVPLELRDVIADFPADVEQLLRRELYTTGEMIRTDGRKALRTLNPATDLDDLEIALVWKKIEWARRQLDSERANAERATRDAITYRCACCAEVLPPTGVGDGHTRQRSLPDGTRVSVCGKCAAVLDRLAVDRLATETVNGGRTRAAAATALLERSRP